MIDVKQAILIAKDKAAEMLERPSSNLEEIERDSYKGRDVWSITLSVPAQSPLALNPPDAHAPVPPSLSPSISLLAALAGGKVEYKRFLIDVESGELLAMKLREVASR